jgi:hypothetical protein
MRIPGGLGLAVAAFVAVSWPGTNAAAQTPPLEAVESPPEAPADSADNLAAWVIATGDNAALPFAIVDKAQAQIAVFAADGRRLAAAPVLLGSALGDDSAPGVGDKRLSAIRPDERTTPAGRFKARFGPAPGGKQVLWIDYGAAISLHPVLLASRREKRLTRLLSPSPKDNRITFGCINVAAGFYAEVVRKAFLDEGGVVYILPDTKPLAEVFPMSRLQTHVAGGGASTEAVKSAMRD